MKKYTVMLSLGLFLVMFFQNCGKPPSSGTSQEVTGVTPSAPQQYNKYSIGPFQTLSVWDFKKARFLDIDMATGQMVAYEEGGQVRGQTYQLTNAQLTDLKAIINGAEICEPVIDSKSSADQMCTMVYRYPYATMIGQGEEVRLGEQVNGCDVPTDLCADKAAQLQAWSKALVESL
jgi:hypothetical protein